MLEAFIEVQQSSLIHDGITLASFREVRLLISNSKVTKFAKPKGWGAQKTTLETTHEA